MSSLVADIRFGIRMLRKSPGVTTVAVVALALGIGANTAVFSVLQAVVLRPLPYADPERLVLLFGDLHRPGLEEIETSAPEFLDYSRRSVSFEALAAYHQVGFNLAGDGEPERVLGAGATAGLFPLLGVAPLLGRTFLPEEDRPGHDQVVLLSHGLWQRRFGGDPDVAGRILRVDGRPCAIVGVMPAGFRFPSRDTELWRPEAFPPELLSENNRGSHFLDVVARLRPGVSLSAARAEMAEIARRMGEEHGDSYRSGFGARLFRLRERLVGDVRPGLILLLGAVGFVLLIACANVANVQLARAAAREKELSIRLALGAGRARLVRQMLAECVVLSAIGGVLGLLLALWGMELLVALRPAAIPRVDEVTLDLRVAAFTLCATLLAGLVSGLAPALHSAGTDVNDALKAGGRGGDGVRLRRLRGALVAVELGLALVLLLGAGLLMRSFLELSGSELGFHADNVLTARLSLPASRYASFERQISAFQEMLLRIAAGPGVRSVGAINALPLSGSGGDRSLLVEGRAAAPGEPRPDEQLRFVGPGYFGALGIPLLRGRDFSAQDRDGAERVLVVNQAMAERYWPGEDALGKRLAYAGMGDAEPKWCRIVGVVGNVRHTGLADEGRPEVYVPYSQPLFGAEGASLPPLYLVVRTEADARGLASIVRAAILSVDPEQPISNVRTMEQRIEESLGERRFSLLLLGFFAAVALGLAVVGVYGVVSYSIAQRTREIGIRMALGARRADVLGLLLRQGLRLALAGVALGLAAAVPLTRLVSGMLYRVSPFDPVSFTAVPLLLVAVAAAAIVVPACRASRVDPMVALRYE